MNQTLGDLLTERLTEEGVTPAVFSTIVNRLYAVGTLVREDSAVESRLYDDAQRIEPLLNDYFSLTGLKLHHNSRFRYFRLYPPAKEVEGEEGESVRRLHHRVSYHFAAYVLGLRHLYQTAMDAGTLNEIGECEVTLPELAQAMLLLLRYQPPSQKTERKKLYDELRSQRLVRLSVDPVGEDEMTIAVRPTILDFVSEQQLAAAVEVAAARAARSGANGSSDAPGASTEEVDLDSDDES